MISILKTHSLNLANKDRHHVALSSTEREQQVRCDATICRGSFGSESGSVGINLNLNKNQLCAALSYNAQYFFRRNFQFSSHILFFLFRFAPSSLVAAQFVILFFFSYFWLKVFFIVLIWALICLHKVLCVVILLLLLQPIEIYTFVWEIN